MIATVWLIDLLIYTVLLSNYYSLIDWLIDCHSLIYWLIDCYSLIYKFFATVWLNNWLLQSDWLIDCNSQDRVKICDGWQVYFLPPLLHCSPYPPTLPYLFFSAVIVGFWLKRYAWNEEFILKIFISTLIYRIRVHTLYVGVDPPP